MSEAQNLNGTPPEATDNTSDRIESNSGESVSQTNPDIDIWVNQPQNLSEASAEVPAVSEVEAEKPQEEQKIKFIGDDGGLRFDSDADSPSTSDETPNFGLFEIDKDDLLEFEPIKVVGEDTFTEKSDSSEPDTDVLELIALSEALQQQNNDLLNHVEELERLLEESQKGLDLQIKRSQIAETKLAEQTKELNKTQEQLTRLFRELEASHQVAQRQQILIETLNQQLQSSQERVAQLERQCAFIQQRYNEQSQLVLQTETARQELQDRLQRQQRYTLQFKAALDKCLEMPALKDGNSDIGSAIANTETQNYAQRLSEALQLLLRPEPIQPWSATPETPTPPVNNTQNDPQENLSGISLPQFSPRVEYESQTIAESVTNNPFFDITNSDFYTDSEPSESVTDSTHDETANIKDAEAALWAELERLTQETVQPVQQVTAPENPVKSDAAILENYSEMVSPSPTEKEESLPPESEIILPIPSPEPSLVSAVSGESSSPKPYPGWPSPVVYPQRPQKKIKSLAAIDLPSFPKISKGEDKGSVPGN